MRKEGGKEKDRGTAGGRERAESEELGGEIKKRNEKLE